MKILMVNYEYPPLGGGGGVAMAQLVRVLGDLHEVSVLTSRARGTPRFQMEDNTTVHRARVLGRSSLAVASMTSMFSFLPAGLLRGCFAINKDRPELINTWFAVPSGPTGVLLSRIYRIPHVLTLIGGDVYDPSKWYSPHRNPVMRSVVRWAMERSRWRTAISTDVRDRARNFMRRPPDIDVVPLGIEPPRFRPVDRAALGMAPDAYYCVTVGRLIRRKRLPLMIDQFARLSDPQLKLILIGEGPEEKKVRQRIRRHGLEGRVELVGAVDDEKKFQYLANSDLYVCTSSHEGFGLVFLEAMACGLPVLAPPVGGQADFLTHGQTGLTLEHDAEDLAKRIQSMFDDPDMAIAMREHNRRHVRLYFVENVADIWAETFERYLKSLF